MDYVLNIIPQMMDGCLVSFQVFIITIVLSIPLGILLSLGRVSGIKPLQALIGGYFLRLLRTAVRRHPPAGL